MAAELNLPESVLDLAEFSPVEDVLLPILRRRLPGLTIVSLIADDPPPLFVLVRRAPPLGFWKGDERFVDYARIYIQVFTPDPDGDEKGAVVSEAVRVALRNAGREMDSVPGKGSLRRVRMLSEPTRKTDWANSQGPVQFADLPSGEWRYETVYDLFVRRPR